MKISSVNSKIPLPELTRIKKINQDKFSNFGNSLSLSSSRHQEGFGPLAEITQNRKILNFTENFMKNEKIINSWIHKLTSGYIPDTSEVIEIQTLLFSHMQKTDLLSKLSESLINSLKRLERMQL